MTTSTLTWSDQYYGSAAAGTTIENSFAALYSSLDAADANADFPWEICSSDLASASTRYITLKRKSGAAGRILLLLGLTTTDGQWNTQIQLGTTAPSSALVVCYREGATSDTPANIRNSSAAIFTGEVQADSTPVTNNVNAVMAVGEFWHVAANEDMLIAYHTTTTHTWDPNSRRLYLVGKILLDPIADTAHSGALHVSAAAWLPTAGINQTSTTGAMTIASGVVEHWGKLADLDANFMVAKARDHVNKKMYFPPMQLGSYQAAVGLPAFKYQIRQIAYQMPSLAGYEEISDGTTHFATSVSATVGNAWWLLNFKLNA